MTRGLVSTEIPFFYSFAVLSCNQEIVSILKLDFYTCSIIGDLKKDLFITGLAKVFDGERSLILESHGEQIIKEIAVKNNLIIRNGHQKLTMILNMRMKLAPCTVDEVKKLLKG